MRVVFSTRFRHEIAIISKFIALDSKKRANAFINSVEKQCSTLSNMPYKYRKSLKFDDENVRDLVFKGYVMPYLVQGDEIHILGIYKENLWEAQNLE